MRMSLIWLKLGVYCLKLVVFWLKLLIYVVLVCILSALFCRVCIMRRILVAGNWKLQGSLTMVEDMVSAIRNELRDDVNVDCAIFPPAVYLPAVAAQAEGSALYFGAQDVSAHEQGAYTGEIAAGMQKEFGCQMVLVGHSERRSYHAETSQQVAQKALAAQKAGLIPVVCIGETLDERESGQTEVVVAEQLSAVLDAEGINLEQMIVAYEPVWAIGTGKTASPEQAQQVHAFIRQMLKNADEQAAEKIQILYGGSVKPDNAKTLFAEDDIDGGLIGGASLKAESFMGIYQAAL